MNGILKWVNFFGPRPWGTGEGQKGTNIKFQLQRQLQRFLNFVFLLTNERYITYQTGFSLGPLGHDLGVLGVGGSKI